MKAYKPACAIALKDKKVGAACGAIVVNPREVELLIMQLYSRLR